MQRLSFETGQDCISKNSGGMGMKKAKLQKKFVIDKLEKTLANMWSAPCDMCREQVRLSEHFPVNMKGERTVQNLCLRCFIENHPKLYKEFVAEAI